MASSTSSEASIRAAVPTQIVTMPLDRIVGQPHNTSVNHLERQRAKQQSTVNLHSFPLVGALDVKRANMLTLILWNIGRQWFAANGEIIVKEWLKAIPWYCTFMAKKYFLVVNYFWWLVLLGLLVDKSSFWSPASLYGSYVERIGFVIKVNVHVTTVFPATGLVTASDIGESCVPEIVLFKPKIGHMGQIRDMSGTRPGQVQLRKRVGPMIHVTSLATVVKSVIDSWRRATRQ